MKLHLTTIVTISALATGIGAASAAGMSNKSMPSAMQTGAKDTLSLTNSQERAAWKDISRQASNQTAPSGFSASVGATVPGDISLKAVPAEVAAEVSSLKPYDYALLKNRLLIVNPNDKKVVDVIDRHA